MPQQSRNFFLLVTFVLVFLAKPGKGSTVIIDPGHNHWGDPGTHGCSGRNESDLNDELSAVLKQSLEKLGIKVLLTRQPKESKSLDDRVIFTNTVKPDVFISMHHDSTQMIYLQKDANNQLRTTKPFHGFSIFIANDNSLDLAVNIGRHPVDAKRLPSLHHAEKIHGEDRELINKELGIFRWPKLKVLRLNNSPAAVLIENGIISDCDDEKWVTSDENKLKIAESISQAISEYLKTSHPAKK